MRRRRRSLTAFAVLAVIAGVIGAPALVSAYSLIGGSLGIGTTGNGYQRDVQVWNNSPDSVSNNNQTPDPAYPGALGAVLAVWKGADAWGSDNPAAARNFEYDYQGTTTANSSTNGNVVGWGDAGCSGGTLAYTETPISDGWRIVMCSTNWSWDDGPGAVAGGTIDIQGVVTHELGHALGLGHSSVGCGASTQAIMCPAIYGQGVQQRTLKSDDQAGLGAIYGTIPASKPAISSLGGSFATGGVLVITGSNFAANVNVKFTANGTQNTGTITGVVYGVPSSAGGTQVSVTIPASAQDGNVIVWEPSLGLMSNAFPIDINYVPPSGPAIASFTPSSVQAFQGGTVTINGSGFMNATQVNVGGTALTGAGFTVVGDTQITFSAPTAAALGPTGVTVTTPIGTSAPSNLTFVETFPAKLTALSVTFTAQIHTWTWGGGSLDNMYLIAATDNTTDTFGTPYPWLANYILVASFPNSAAGTGSFNLQIPPGLSGVTFYSQIASVDEINGSFSGSNITSSVILF